MLTPADFHPATWDPFTWTAIVFATGLIAWIIWDLTHPAPPRGGR